MVEVLDIVAVMVEVLEIVDVEKFEVAYFLLVAVMIEVQETVVVVDEEEVLADEPDLWRAMDYP